MDLKETGKKLKPFAPVLSVAVVASCVAGTLSGYQPPVYAAQEQTNSVKEETTKSEEQEQAVKGSFDLTDGVYKGTGTGYVGEITVAVQIKDKQIVAIDILSSSDDADSHSLVAARQQEVLLLSQQWKTRQHIRTELITEQGLDLAEH